MKHFFPILLCILLGCSFVSCEKDVTVRPYVPSYVKGRLGDGGRINQILLSTEETSFSNYSDIKIKLKIDATSKVSPLITSSNSEKINELKKEYVLAKSLFIQESYDIAMKTLDIHDWNMGWPDLYTAYVNGDVTITCDKPLFGEEPGTNLSKYFRVIPRNSCMPVGVAEPYLLYDFGDSIPTNINELFAKEAWLHYIYNLFFEELPSEQYKDLTLRVSIPMLLECYEDYVVAEYIGQPLESKYREATFSRDLKINFDWKK